MKFGALQLALTAAFSLQGSCKLMSRDSYFMEKTFFFFEGLYQCTLGAYDGMKVRWVWL